MQAGQPSRTAMGAAMHRAAHQEVERGETFSDPFALPIIGPEARRRLDEWAGAPQRRPMRLFIAARHRIADEKVARALERGTRQVVILGAGLDTTALRAAAGTEVRYFEVDHPATQAWKRQRLAEAGLEPPESLTFAPVDFEAETLAQGLAAVGFDTGAPAFFVWLGVVPYLTEEAIRSTLRFIAGVPAAEVVFDYANPPSQLGPEVRERHERRAARMAEIGEAWISYFDSQTLAAELTALGAVEIEDLGPADIQRDILGMADPRYAGAGGHIVWVRWPAR